MGMETLITVLVLIGLVAGAWGADSRVLDTRVTPWWPATPRD